MMTNLAVLGTPSLVTRHPTCLRHLFYPDRFADAFLNAVSTSITILLVNDGWAAKIDPKDGPGWAGLFCGAGLAS